jgi:hypothetical protein
MDININNTIILTTIHYKYNKWMPKLVQKKAHLQKFTELCRLHEFV